MRVCHITANGMVCQAADALGGIADTHPLLQVLKQPSVILWYMPTCEHCETIMANARKKMPQMPKQVIMVDISHLWKQVAEGEYTKVRPLLTKIKWVPQVQSVPAGVAAINAPTSAVTLTSADQLLTAIKQTT